MGGRLISRKRSELRPLRHDLRIGRLDAEPSSVNGFQGNFGYIYLRRRAAGRSSTMREAGSAGLDSREGGRTLAYNGVVNKAAE
jgi:hypothetical protein